MALGAAMILSASFQESSPERFFSRQLLGIAIALPLLVFVSHLNLRLVERAAFGAVIVSILLQLMVWIPGFSAVDGVRRWLDLGLFSFQPSELAKLSLAVYLASILARKRERVKDLMTGVLPPLVLSLMSAGVVMIAPDFSTGMLIILLMLAMLYVSGMRVTHMLLIGVILSPVIYLLLVLSDFRIERIWDWWHFIQSINAPGTAEATSHLVRLVEAIQEGGLWGQGIGHAESKQLLPEANGDSIFAVYVAELGLLGGLLAVSLLGLIVVRGYRLAYLLKDRFFALLAFGLSTLLTLQVLLNIAVATTALPITGLPLPFLSAGATSLVMTALAVGLLLALSRRVGRIEPADEDPLPRTGRLLNLHREPDEVIEVSEVR